MRAGKKGTTLVELIAAITILSVIIFPLYLLLNSGYKYFFMDTETMVAQREARNAMELIMNDLRQYGNKNTLMQNDSNALYVDSDLIYTYDSLKGTLSRKYEDSSTSVFRDDTEVDVKAFTIEKIPPAKDYDDYVIKITLALTAKNSEEIKLEEYYRIKVTN